MLTEATVQVTIDVPRDRDGSFEPQIVKERQSRLNGVKEMNEWSAGPLDEGRCPVIVANSGPRTGEIAS